MSFIKDFWGSFKKKVTPREKLEEFAQKIFTDEKFENRIEALKTLAKKFEEKREASTPEETLEYIRAKTELIDSAIQVVAEPYGRAGSERAYSLVQKGWHSIYSLTIMIIDSVENLFKSLDQDDSAYDLDFQKTVLIAQLHHCFNRIYHRFGKNVIGGSWKDIDIAERHVTIIQNIQQGVNPRYPGGKPLGEET